MYSAAAAVPRRVARRFTIYPAAKRGLASGAAGNTLSGRSRFYKNVGIQSLEIPPWKTINSSSSNDDRVASPVSAGVDGTQSATGVHHIPQDTKTCRLEELLTPRLPRQEFDADNNTKWYGITLDGRKVSTPMGQILAVPSETLAYMIAAEWDSQRKDIQPSNMPLMTLACTALDQAAIRPQFYRDAALLYLTTDTTCFWADPTEDRLLHRRQQKAWKGLHEFCTKKLDGFAPITAYGMEGILMSRKRGEEKPKAGLPHPQELTTAATRWTASLDAWQLVALNSIATQAKSWLIAFSLLETDSPFKDIAQASEASRVEEEFQISVWGLVEGQHDYDRLNSSVQLHSATLFAKTILLEHE